MLIIFIFCSICFNVISTGQSLWRTTSDSTETSDCIDRWIYDVIQCDKRLKFEVVRCYLVPCLVGIC